MGGIWGQRDHQPLLPLTRESGGALYSMLEFGALAKIDFVDFPIVKNASAISFYVTLPENAIVSEGNSTVSGIWISSCMCVWGGRGENSKSLEGKT